MTFCDEIRKECNDLWQAIFDHPFIKNIASGELQDHFRKSNHDEWHFRNMAWTQQQWTIDTPELVANQS